MISESQIKLVKKNRSRSKNKRKLVIDNFWKSPKVDEFNWKLVLPEGVHVPNKKESKMMRQICAKTGLTREKVRKEKVYRVMLAIAANPQRKPGKRYFASDLEKSAYKRALSLRKYIAKTTGMIHHHPDFFAIFKENWLKNSYGAIYTAEKIFKLIK